MYLLLNCKSPAPFGAARFQNTTTVAGRHTFHKAVFTLARYAFWLPGTFHLTLLSPPLRILVDYSGYPYNLSIVEAEVEHVGRDYAFNVFILADKSALAAINRALLVRLASFAASEIASEAIWIDANRSNEAWRTTMVPIK